NRSLQSQKNLPLIQKPRQHEKEREAHCGNHYISHSLRDVEIKKLLHISSGKPLRYFWEAHHIAQHIKSQRIRPYPHEGGGPFFVTPNFDDLVKGPHEERAVTPRNEHVRGGPDFLD